MSKSVQKRIAAQQGKPDPFSSEGKAYEQGQKELATEYRSLLEGMRDAAKKFGLLQSASTIESAITALDEWCQEKGL